MKLLALSLLLVTLAVGILADHHEVDHEKEIGKIEGRLEKVAYRMLKLDHDIDTRVDPARFQRIKSVRYRIQQVEGTGCRKDYFQCGGSDPQCVNNLLVCDGHKDCRNGADEINCKTPLKAGDVFVGSVVYDKCGLGQINTIEFDVKSVDKSTFFTPVTKLSVNLVITKEGVGNSEHVLFSPAFYELATHRLKLSSTQSNRLGFNCKFDGADFDHCTAYSIHEGSLHDCAKYLFTRKHD